MSNPTSSQPAHRSSSKRKRSASQISASSSRRYLPPETINPLSHPPNLLKQYRLAGLHESERLPSVPDFPHRPLPHREDGDGGGGGDRHPFPDETATETEVDPDTETDAQQTLDDTEAEAEARRKADRRARGVRRDRRARERNVGALVAILRRCVESGDTARARRAFGLLARADVYGKRVDLRSEGYWGLGGEILMTQGMEMDRRLKAEGQGQEEEEEAEGGSRRKPRRWGSAANMVSFTRYFEELIQLYPYSRLHPNSLSAQDFYPQLFNAEIYNIVSEFDMALERAEEEVEEEEELAGAYEDGHGMGMEPDMDMNGSWNSSLTRSREGRLKGVKDKLRTDALEATRRVAGRMDELMQNLPYNKNLEMMRLRGMIALLMGDLAMPAQPRSEEEEYDGTTRKERERERAVKLFQKVRAQGGELDPWIRELVREFTKSEDDEEDESTAVLSLPMFSSIPLR